MDRQIDTQLLPAGVGNIVELVVLMKNTPSTLNSINSATHIFTQLQDLSLNCFQADAIRFISVNDIHFLIAAI